METMCARLNNRDPCARWLGQAAQLMRGGQVQGSPTAMGLHRAPAPDQRLGSLDTGLCETECIPHSREVNQATNH